MRRTNPANLLLLALATAAVITLAMQFGADVGAGLAVTTWVEWAAILLLALMILRLGYSVRAYQKGDKPSLDGIRAARTLALAKAGSLTGAVLLGRYGAVVLMTLADWNFGDARQILINAAVASIAALALIVASLVAEKWCELPPSPPEVPTTLPAEIPQHSTAYQARSPLH